MNEWDIPLEFKTLVRAMGISSSAPDGNSLSSFWSCSGGGIGKEILGVTRLMLLRALSDSNSIMSSGLL